MDPQMENLDSNRHAPEVAREKGDVEEGGGGHAEEHRRERVEDGEDKRVARQVPADPAVPVSRAERRAVEDGSLHAVDGHAPEGELADDFVQRALADEVLLEAVAEAVEGGAEQGEEVALDLVGRGEGIVARQLVRAEEHADAADGEEDAEDLRPVVAHAQEGEGHYHHDDDGPEVY